MRTIFRRSFTGFLAVIAVLTVLAPLLTYDTIRSRLNNLAIANLTDTARSLDFVLSPFIDSQPAELDSIVDGLGSRLGFRITVISRDGTVLADSEENPDSMENHRTRPEVIAAFNGNVGTSSRRSATLGREMIYVAVPVSKDDSIPAVIRTSLFFSEQRSLLTGILVDIAIVIAVASMAGLIMAWFLSRSISRPIRSMAESTRKVGEGDYSRRLAPSRIRELSWLAADINGMISRTHQLIDELSSRNASMDAILRSIAGGLVVIDSAGTVVKGNNAFRTMSGAGDREDGLNYLEYVAESEISGFLGDVLREGVRSGEISAAGRIYSARASAIEGTDRFVVTFRDITEIMETARMKREFAANASHELRTPLTAIKGYGETLLEELTGDPRKYMETILRNTDRLIRIVEDMRILSELEHPMTSLDLSRVNIAELITNIVELFRQKAEEKGLELVTRIEEKLPVVTADEFRIQQVLINLIENAIRYTSSGTVTVMAGKRGQFLTVIVSDTGPGIEEKHLPRLFERFYVVDKARSRDRGGTGLGLAIVKHIMTLHDGWVRVTSQPGSGSMFTVGLPLDSKPLQ